MLQPLSEADTAAILRRALADGERGLGGLPLAVDEEAVLGIARYANGDGRVALNLLEFAAASAPSVDGVARVDAAFLKQSIERRALLYDKTGEEHYNLISALHKSMRNSDPDAAVYWLARMLEAGEDPLYIARRLIRFASEDVGNADPQALTVAVAAKDACHFIGMPEGNTALTQAVTYLATAPKSNAVYKAYLRAAEDAHSDRAEPVPLHLRNAPTKLMKQLEYGKDYQYAHDDADAVTGMDCLPPNLAGRKYYQPTERGFEKEIKRRLDGWAAIRNAADRAGWAASARPAHASRNRGPRRTRGPLLTGFRPLQRFAADGERLGSRVRLRHAQPRTRAPNPDGPIPDPIDPLEVLLDFAARDPASPAGRAGRPWNTPSAAALRGCAPSSRGSAGRSPSRPRGRPWWPPCS